MKTAEEKREARARAGRLGRAWVLCGFAAGAAFAAAPARAAGFLVAVSSGGRVVLYSESDVRLAEGEALYVAREGKKVAVLRVAEQSAASIVADVVTVNLGIELREYEDKAYHPSELIDMEEEGSEAEMKARAAEPEGEGEAAPEAPDDPAGATGGNTEQFQTVSIKEDPARPRIVWTNQIESIKTEDKGRLPRLYPSHPLALQIPPMRERGVGGGAFRIDLGEFAPYLKAEGEATGIQLAFPYKRYEASLAGVRFSMRQTQYGNATGDLDGVMASIHSDVRRKSLKMVGVTPTVTLGVRHFYSDAGQVGALFATSYWEGDPLDFSIGTRIFYGDNRDAGSASLGVAYTRWDSSSWFVNYEWRDYLRQITDGRMLMEPMGFANREACARCDPGALTAGATFRFKQDRWRLTLLAHDLGGANSGAVSVQYRPGGPAKTDAGVEPVEAAETK